MDTSEIQFRPFHNADPPRLVQLWHEADLGRGAAAGFTVDALDFYVFAQPYFDKAGFIVAEIGERIVGFVHAGFGCDESKTALCNTKGVICALIVHPKYRRQGIARQLIDHATAFLNDAGATQIAFGSSTPVNPFYVGLYGGAQPNGFLESDPIASQFSQAMNFSESKRYAVFQRNMKKSRDPIAMRLMQNKRRFQLRLQMKSNSESWWWAARFGRLDCVTALLVRKNGEGNPVAQAHCYGLDMYINKWGDRSVGIRGIEVPEEHRRNGYAQTLLVEICNRMKRELIPIIDIHASEDDPVSMGLIKSAGFSRVDTGIVYSASGAATTDVST